MTVISKGVFAYNMNVAYTNELDIPNNTAFVEAQYDLASSIDTNSAKTASAPYLQGSVNIADVVQGEQYRVRLRYVSETGRIGLWSAYTTHFIAGSTTNPVQVTNFTAIAESNLGKVRLSWNKNPEEDIRGYEVRDDINFGQQIGLIALGEEVTCYAAPPALPGTTKTYYVAALDYYGGYSSTLTKVIYTYPLVQEVSSISYNFSDDSLTSAVITFNWSTPVTEYAVDYYEVAFNGTVKEVKSNTITLPANWVGNRSFTIRTVDINGNKSVGVDTVAVKLLPGIVTSFRSQVIDNTVMLYWTLPVKTTLPIDHIEVRKGPVWATAAKLGEKKGEFTSLIELIKGEFTYWVAAVDTDDNIGEPVSLRAQVAEPPDFEFFASFDSTFTGTMINATRSTAGVLMPVNSGEIWSQHFGSRTWDTTQDQVTAGFPLYIQPTVTAGYYEEVFDYGTLLASSKISLEFTGSNITGVTSIDSSLAFSTDGVTYTTYNGTISIFATNFRYVKVRVTATNSNTTALYELTRLKVTLDAKKKFDSLSVSAVQGDSLGTIVNFSREFIDVQTLQGTAQSSLPLFVVVDFKDSVLAATYSVSANVCTVNFTAHSFIVGQKIRFANISGTALTGIYTITSATANAFTFALTTANTSGNAQIYPQSCRVYVFNTTTSPPVRATAVVSLDISGY
jgi:hypothetical protein